MRHTEAVTEFAENVLPGVVRTYGPNDRPAQRQAWNDWTDDLCKSGRITPRQYDTWTGPDFRRLLAELP